MTTTVTTTSFDNEVLDSEQPVIVDFWAEWCGPCRAVAPVLDQIAEERAEIKVVKVNIDEEPDARATVRDHEHPDDHALQGRRARCGSRRRPAEEDAREVARPGRIRLPPNGPGRPSRAHARGVADQLDDVPLGVVQVDRDLPTRPAKRPAYVVPGGRAAARRPGRPRQPGPRSRNAPARARAGSARGDRSRREAVAEAPASRARPSPHGRRRRG